MNEIESKKIVEEWNGRAREYNRRKQIEVIRLRNEKIKRELGMSIYENVNEEGFKVLEYLWFTFNLRLRDFRVSKEDSEKIKIEEIEIDG